MGLRSNHVTGTSFALAGQTPIVRATGQRFWCSMISAITNRGQLVFRVFHSTFTEALFVDFLKRLLKQGRRKVYLIVDGHPVYRSRLANAFVAMHATRIRLIQLPGYCPEMLSTVRNHLYRHQKQPHVVRHLFQEKNVRDAG